MNKEKMIIISLGGSLIVPSSGIDWKFLKKFRQLILEQIKKGKKVYLIAGGGDTCRKYNQAAQKVIKITPEDLDWLGIHSSRLNAHLIRTIFHDVAHPEIIKNPTIYMPSKERVIVGGGWKPGWSTDYVATMIAQEYEIKTLINLSNINYAYNKDPKKYKDAKAIKEINWASFRKIVGDKWVPGLNAPFDPIASRKAEQLGLEVIIADGKNLTNLKRILDNRTFKGTIIK